MYEALSCTAYTHTFSKVSSTANSHTETYCKRKHLRITCRKCAPRGGDCMRVDVCVCVFECVRCVRAYVVRAFACVLLRVYIYNIIHDHY